MRLRRLRLAVGLALAFATTPVAPFGSAAPPIALAAGSCGLAQPAFCDPLNQPTANGPDIRSGDLNGVVWGVSRGTSSDNPTQGAYQFWEGTTGSLCGQTRTFGSPNEVRICNGGLFETVTDGGAFTTLAMYPRQPFDIAGRTGRVAFDLSADGLCGHCAWPAFEYTDQPVPAPNNISSGPRNGFGFTFNSVGTCASESQEGVGNMWVTANYVSTFVDLNDVGCVTSGHAGGPLNHFEIRMSASHVEVWGSDAGSTTLKQLATANLSMPLTRGLVWMEDQHYNAGKASSQGTHTFEWANFGFDGPVLPRDLGFDARDAGDPDARGGRSLGYLCQPTCQVNIPNVTAAGLAAAQGALLEFTWAPSRADTLNYSFNGHAAHTFPWPYPDGGGLHTIAIPVSLSELQAGTNALTIDASGDVWDMANIDIILVAAGGVGGSVVVGNSPTPTRTPTTSATPTPMTTTGGGGAQSTGGNNNGAGGGRSAPTSVNLAGVGGGASPAFVAVPTVPDSPALPQVASTPAPASTLEPPPAQVTYAAQLTGSSGGELAVPDLGLTITVPAEALGGQDAALQVAQVPPESVPNSGVQAGERGFELSITGSSTGEQLTSFPAPILLLYTPSADELALANGNLSRVSLTYWDGTTWLPLPCTASGQQLSCTLPHLGRFQLMISSPKPGPADFDLPNGHFYRQTNGFGGSGDAGYSITDDAEAAFWTEFQRLGGVEALGYPVSNRFSYQGFTAQAFQKAALEWQPDLGIAIPVNIFDNLDPATDAWLDIYRQVPPSLDWTADANEPWDQVVAEHQALLDAYPPLHDLYFSDADPITTYGLPLSVREYDSMVVVRTQRATLQLWVVDTPSAAAGTVVVGNAGDIAKEAGIWPSQAIVPQLPPTADTPEVARDD